MCRCWRRVVRNKQNAPADFLSLLQCQSFQQPNYPHNRSFSSSTAFAVPSFRHSAAASKVSTFPFCWRYCYCLHRCSWWQWWRTMGTGWLAEKEKMRKQTTRVAMMLSSGWITCNLLRSWRGQDATILALRCIAPYLSWERDHVPLILHSLLNYFSHRKRLTNKVDYNSMVWW